MLLLKNGIRNTSRIQEMKLKRAKIPNRCVVENSSNFPPQIPARRFPTKLVKNHPPIISDKNFLGASFETKDNPIGDRHSSAIVIIK